MSMKIMMVVGVIQYPYPPKGVSVLWQPYPPLDCLPTPLDKGEWVMMMVVRVMMMMNVVAGVGDFHK